VEGLPSTVVIDRKGNVRYTHFGIINKDEVEKIIKTPCNGNATKAAEWYIPCMWQWLVGLLAFMVLTVALFANQHRLLRAAEVNRQHECFTHSITAESMHKCVEEARGREDYLPWWYGLIAWPQGLETWAVILTLAAIAWQSNETRKSAVAALLNALPHQRRTALDHSNPSYRIAAVLPREAEGRACSRKPHGCTSYRPCLPEQTRPYGQDTGKD
jgi:hypothetical protein